MVLCWRPCGPAALRLYAYALAAARALLQHSSLTAAEIAREALVIAGGICVYTNDRIQLEEL